MIIEQSLEDTLFGLEPRPFYDQNGELLTDADENMRYELSVLGAMEAQAMALKSGYEVRASAFQIVDDMLYGVFLGNMEIGSSSHAEDLAVRVLVAHLVKAGIEPSIQYIGFFDPGEKRANGGIATICGLCRDTLRDNRYGKPLLADNAMIIGAGEKAGVVTPWKTYLSEKWSPVEDFLMNATLKTQKDSALKEWELSDSVYPDHPKFVGGFKKGLEVYLVGSGDYSKADRDAGPLITATWLFKHKNKVGGAPEAFVYYLEDGVGVSYTHRQMIGDRIRRLGIPRDKVGDFPIILYNLDTDVAMQSTLARLLPYRFTSTGS